MTFNEQGSVLEWKKRMIDSQEQKIAEMRTNNEPQDKIDDALDWLRILNEDIRRLENNE